MVERPLSALRNDMGNTLCNDMGNTFCASGRLGKGFWCRGRTGVYPDANPAHWAFKGLRRGMHRFWVNIRDPLAECRKCYPCRCAICNPCRCAPPSPALSPLVPRGEREEDFRGLPNPKWRPGNRCCWATNRAPLRGSGRRAGEGFKANASTYQDMLIICLHPTPSSVTVIETC